MTVALVLAGEAEAGPRDQLCGQLAALGVRRVDAAERTGSGLLTVAAAARTAGERVLVCVGADAVPEPVLARLLAVGGTAAFTGVSALSVPPPFPADAPAAAALVVDPPDLAALAGAAEALAATYTGPDPVSPVGALFGELTRRGVMVRILDAGPDADGPVTQLIADPAARDMASWAAWRQLTPAALYGISLGLGLVAAVWFAELAVRGKLAAVVALAASFLTARAGSLLAATSPEGRVRPLVSWLGTACGLLTEFALYAALAVSASLTPGTSAGLAGTFGGQLQDTFVANWGGAGSAGVWRLAIAAMLLLGVRKLAALSYEHIARAEGELFPRSVPRTLEQALTFPAGERYLVIVLTAVFVGPRLTFGVLLGWGVLAGGYVLAGSIARSARGTRATESPLDDAPPGETPPDGTAFGETPPDGTAFDETPPDGTAFGKTPPDGTAFDETVLDGTAFDETAPDELPPDELPLEEVALDEAPLVQAPRDEAPRDEVPQDVVALDEAPLVQAPRDELLPDEAAWDEVPLDEAGLDLAAYRGDGPLASWIGELVQGRLPPLPPVLAGLLVTGVLTALGLGNLPGILVLTPVEAMMLAALGARHPHDGRLDWLVPALLMAGEGVFLAALGLARLVPAWLVYALLTAVVLRHVDLVFRARAGRGPYADVAGLGWDGRMLLAAAAAGAGITPLAYVALTGYLWVLFIWEFLSGWLRPADGENVDRDGPRGRRGAAAPA
jgi:Family of unknown function (DUF5941)